MSSPQTHCVVVSGESPAEGRGVLEVGRARAWFTIAAPGRPTSSASVKSRPSAILHARCVEVAGGDGAEEAARALARRSLRRAHHLEALVPVGAQRRVVGRRRPPPRPGVPPLASAARRRRPRAAGVLYSGPCRGAALLRAALLEAGLDPRQSVQRLCQQPRQCHQDDRQPRPGPSEVAGGVALRCCPSAVPDPRLALSRAAGAGSRQEADGTAR